MVSVATFLRFDCGGCALAIPIERVVRIVARPSLIVPPDAPPVVDGLYMDGSELVCVLRLSLLLDLPERGEPGLYDHVMQLRSEGPQIALQVDRVRAVFTRVNGDATAFSDGLQHRGCVGCQLDDAGEPIQILDVARLITTFEKEAVGHLVVSEERRRAALTRSNGKPDRPPRAVEAQGHD